MNCPECKARLKASVVGTDSFRTFIHRQRRCPRCGVLIDTEEVIIGTRPPSDRAKLAIQEQANVSIHAPAQGATALDRALDGPDPEIVCEVVEQVRL